VEPFFGSGAVLFLRPTPPKIETVNDLDCYIANVWRSVKADPETVADYCDYPVNEADLYARHRWLISRKDELREKIMADPDYYDAKAAGWWIWGISQWIGGGWCKIKRSANQFLVVGREFTDCHVIVQRAIERKFLISLNGFLGGFVRSVYVAVTGIAYLQRRQRYCMD